MGTGILRDLAGRAGRGLAALLVAALWLGAGGPAVAQADAGAPAERPVFQVIVGIAPGSRVNLRAGPATIFPVVATLGYGERVQRLGCQDSFGMRWCRVRTEGAVAVTGWVAARYLADALPPGGDDLAGGPDFWAVRGLGAGDLLNVRAQPSAQARVLATLREGEVVRNLGCRMSGQTRWCRIRSTTGFDVTGWVNGRFLRESGGPPAGGGAGTGGSGPDFWVVAGLPAGDTLNLRAGPSAQSAILARLREGTRLRNLGCEQRGQTRWCLVRTTGSTDLTGWVSGRYLRESR